MKGRERQGGRVTGRIARAVLLESREEVCDTGKCDWRGKTWVRLQ